MSNKTVPSIYRAIIDDVITAIKSEFDEYGVGEDVLADLHARWQNKVIASHVAEFDTPPPNPPPAHHFPPHGIPNGPVPGHHPSYPPYHPAAPPPPQHPLVKSEPVDPRFPLATYSIPALPGPQLNGASRPSAPATSGAPVTSYAQRPLPPPVSVPRPSPYTQASTGAQQPTARIPQVDGPHSSASDTPSPPSSQLFAPHSNHQSLPTPSQKSEVSNPADTEEINSDLDDSDSDAEEEDQEGVTGDTDIVFCTYDKVARVKNKWKCILKDGMIHVNNKDYLFAKCTCEFEW